MRFLKIIFFLKWLVFLGGVSFLRAEYVQAVVDGDTFVLESQQRVRMIGIDAPEIDHPQYGRFGEFYGEEAKAYLKSVIEAKEVRLESGDESFDKYGRRLAYVFVGDLFVNREMILLGYAEVFRAFDFSYKNEFLELEHSAKSQGRGLWNPGLRQRYENENSGPPEQERHGVMPLAVAAGLTGSAFGIYFFIWRKRHGGS